MSQRLFEIEEEVVGKTMTDIAALSKASPEFEALARIAVAMAVSNTVKALGSEGLLKDGSDPVSSTLGGAGRAQQQAVDMALGGLVDVLTNAATQVKQRIAEKKQP